MRRLRAGTGGLTMDKKYIDADFLKQKISREWDMQELYLPVHFFDVVDDLPAADVQEVKHGHWISEHIGYGVTRYKCSVCGGRFGIIEDFPPNKFCPNCGARMDGKDGDIP